MNKVFTSGLAAALLSFGLAPASNAATVEVCNGLPVSDSVTVETVNTLDGKVNEYTGTNAADVMVINLDDSSLFEVVKVKVDTMMGNDSVCFIGGNNSTVENVEAFMGNGLDFFEGSGLASYFVHGGLGNDLISGGSGNDLLMGYNGNDKIWGNDGDDEISGGLGNDTLYGGKGFDALSGRAGHDVLYGGANFDVFSGGLGRNVFNVEDGETVSDLKNNRVYNTLKIKGVKVAEYDKGKLQ